VNINSLPVVGWILSAVFAVSTAIPFWMIWTACGLGRKYFYFLPEVYQSIGFWECVGLFVVVGILKSLLTPRFVSVSQSNTTEGTKK
jgi:hypothetical protein